MYKGRETFCTVLNSQCIYSLSCTFAQKYSLAHVKIKRKVNNLNHVLRESAGISAYACALLKYLIIISASLGASVLLLGIKFCIPKSLTEHAYLADFKEETK